MESALAGTFWKNRAISPTAGQMSVVAILQLLSLLIARIRGMKPTKKNRDSGT
jgi:hypothetical protein